MKLLKKLNKTESADLFGEKHLENQDQMFNNLHNAGEIYVLPCSNLDSDIIFVPWVCSKVMDS